MNTAEHIVESYFRYCRDCFTIADRKVLQGNNRQFDILAYNINKKQAFHIEVNVTHCKNWCSKLEDLEYEFEKKFFGAPSKRDGKYTDFTKNKDYFSKIEETYSSIGFIPSKIKRVWVCWFVKGEVNNSKPIMHSFESVHLGQKFEIEVLSLRDLILPELADTIGTANYEDEILRTIAFIKQRELQSGIS